MNDRQNDITNALDWLNEPEEPTPEISGNLVNDPTLKDILNPKRIREPTPLKTYKIPSMSDEAIAKYHKNRS